MFIEVEIEPKHEHDEVRGGIARTLTVGRYRENNYFRGPLY
jgi:hypothetical protein